MGFPFSTWIQSLQGAQGFPCFRFYAGVGNTSDEGVVGFVLFDWAKRVGTCYVGTLNPPKGLLNRYSFIHSFIHSGQIFIHSFIHSGEIFIHSSNSSFGSNSENQTQFWVTVTETEKLTDQLPSSQPPVQSCFKNILKILKNILKF